MSDGNSEIRRRLETVMGKILRPALAPLGIEVIHPDIKMPGDFFRHIVESALHADLLIADVSGANPNVCLELGCRLPTGKPIILISRDLSTLPSDLLWAKTIAFDDTTAAGISQAIRDVREYSENALHGAVPIAEATQQAAPRQAKPDRPWRITPVETLEASMTEVIDSETKRQLAGLLLQRIAHDPTSGERVAVGGRDMYVVKGSAWKDASSISLIYGVDEKNRSVQPAVFSSNLS